MAFLPEEERNWSRPEPDGDVKHIPEFEDMQGRHAWRSVAKRVPGHQGAHAMWGPAEDGAPAGFEPAVPAPEGQAAEILP